MHGQANGSMQLLETAEDTERRAAEAFSRLAYGLPPESTDARCALRRATLCAITFAWAARYAHAQAERAETQRFLDEAAELDRTRRNATSEEPYPLSLQGKVRRAHTAITALLREADSDLIGLELALDYVASLLGFDADAGRKLVGVRRWRSSTVDQVKVESCRSTTVSYLLALANTLET